jgi:hypothetical protein
LIVRTRHEVRSGLTLVDVIVLLVLVIGVVLLLLMGVSRGREQARLAGCRKNLAQIGFALALYDQMHGHLPEIESVAPPDRAADQPSPGPLKVLLEDLVLPDLSILRDRITRPQPRPGQVPGEIPVPGFVCSSDPNALAGRFRASISYRATTGDNITGDNGAFAVGTRSSLAAIEAGDGMSYTAAFSERLVGDDQPGHAVAVNYEVLPPPLPSGGCPRITDPAAWRGDAGSSWAAAGYRSTLYNHALPPNGQPSCIAASGKSAYMGASSGHVGGVNLLLLDGSVSTIRASINPKIWRDYAAITASSEAPSSPILLAEPKRRDGAAAAASPPGDAK